MMLNTALETIDYSLVQLNTLYRLSALEQLGQTDESKKLLHIATENIVSSIITDTNNISLETLGSSIGNAIDKVWDTIVKALTWIWNTIRGIFVSDKVEKENKDIKYNQDKVKDIIKKANDNIKFEQDTDIPDSLTLPFQYLRKDTITHDDIQNKLLEQQLLLPKLETLCMEMVGALHALSKTDLDPLKIVQTFASINNYIEQNFTSFELNVNKNLLDTLNININYLDIDKNRLVGSFLRNNDMVLLALKLDTGLEYSMRMINDHTRIPKKVNIRYFKANELESFTVLLEKTQTKFINTQDMLDKKIKSIKLISDQLLNKLKKEYGQSGVSLAQQSIMPMARIAEGVTITLKFMSDDLSTYKQLYDENVRYYSTNE